MKKFFLKMLPVFLVAAVSIGFTSCGDPDPIDGPIDNDYVRVNGMSETSLSFSSNSGIEYKQTVQVSSNVNWVVNGIPDWLSVSPTNGNGEVSMTIYPKTENNKDDKARTAELILTSGASQAIVRITQDTDLDDGAYVIPTNIVTLYNGIAFDYKFGNNVSYYYRGYMEKTAAASMTDSEIIQELETNFRRYTISDNEVAVFDGLDEGVAYMVYTIGYNKDGERGKLTKNEVRTKTLQNNEPVASITSPSVSGNNWVWSVEKSATCDSYYMITTQNEDFAFSPDVYQAWMIDYNIRKGEISEYINGGNWYATKINSIIAVMTWGRNRNNKFANRISWNYGLASSSSSMRSQKQGKNTKIDANYPIGGKEMLTIYKME